jgi:LPXTG-motif cell wall-anchored protein
VVTPGMPTTGHSDGSTFFGVLALMAVSISALTLGWLARRNAVR